MSIMPIRLLGDPVLREPGAVVTDFGPDLERLVDDMIETMEAAGGAGLAAPQVGVQLRVFVYDANDGAGPRAVVNPSVSDPEGSGIYDEGCLSVPGVFVDIERPEAVTVRWQDLDAGWHEERADGFYARVFQHEMDHCDGRVFLDRAERRARKDALRRFRELVAPGQTSYVPDGSAGRARERAL